MKLLVGLGNPGSRHAGQRHNIGFMAVDEIHRHEDFSAWRERFQGSVAEGKMGDEKVLLLKPSTYMNESGRAVGEAMRFFKLEPRDIVVFYDELDLAPGKIRVKTGGGAGGHNGIRSIDQHVSNGFRRVRMGIGHPGQKDLVTRHVLGDFSKSDQSWLESLLDETGRNAHLLVAGDDAGFMNRVALRTQSNEPSGAKGQSSARAKKQSHVHQARNSGPKVKLPNKGPMADMLAKILRRGD
ncbi:MAG: aminoacyl-tRNA hydrolase [Ahrensia sp.]|nr:aminoacyl-tRNA hydrolase [Ahrensia sp.]